MITPYGYNNAFLMLGAGICLILLALTPVGTILSVVLITLGTILSLFTLWFFRDSERPLHPEALQNPLLVMAPADGQVMEVERLDSHAYTSGPTLHVTIFLSPINLHVNRYPASGIITSAKYIPGKYLMAFNPKSSEENERSVFHLQTAGGTVVYTQITGFLARRIVYDTKTGDRVTVGNRFGMMKFGSRMDLFLPENARVEVKPGQSVVSCKDIIARLTAVEGTL